MDITSLSSSSSSSAPFFREDSSNSTILLTPNTLREHCSVTFRRSTSPPPYGAIPRAYDRPYLSHHLHRRQLTLIESAINESDIADQLHLVTEPLLSAKQSSTPKPLLTTNGPIGPHVTNLPRRRIRTQCAKPVESTPQPTPKRASQQDECRCLQELVPGLFVAFEDDRLAFGDAAAGERLKTFRGEDFTHIISVSTESVAEAAMARATRAESHLRLVIPAAPDAPDDDDDIDVRPQLSQSQLLAARGFLSSSNLRLSPDAYAQSVDVRVLITVPRNHRVDAISIASCYLSFATGHSVRRVLAHFDDGECYLGIWQGVMDWQAWDFIEDVARN